jgi:hypothetical protein
VLEALKDGSTLFRERYESRDRVYASLVLGDGRLYAQLRDGTCIVMAADPEYTILAENKLGDGDEQFNATPALDEGRISSVQPKPSIALANRRRSNFLLVSSK